ncbi:hypothetical protein bAD24_III11835 [Burkholderia sp. AD24]|nr:hypothetical protein bAD24_III11835 [Burkholderia sp. AD24]
MASKQRKSTRPPHHCSFISVSFSSVHIPCSRKFFHSKGSFRAMPKPKLSDAVAAGLSERLLTIRKRKGLSQEKLSAQVLLARVNLANVEQGRRANLRLTTLARIADALGVDVIDFFCDRDPTEQKPKGEDATARLVLNVKRLRAKAGLSQHALSEKASRSRAYVGRLETGVATPMVVDLHDLALALGASIPDLFLTAHEVAQLESSEKDK